MANLPKPPRNLFSSRFARLVVLIFLTILMFIPLGLVSSVVTERSHYHDAAMREVSNTWGGNVSIAGPALVIPVERSWIERVKDNDGNITTRARKGPADPVILLPEVLDVAGDLTSSVRARGVFEVPVYEAGLEMRFAFDTSVAAAGLPENESLIWDRSKLLLMLPASRSFRSEAVLLNGSKEMKLEPGTPLSEVSGIQSAIGDPRGAGEFTMNMTLGGAQTFRISPSARQTWMELKSDWPHPSFNGDFLPQARKVSEEGFTASWEIPHLARDVPQRTRDVEQLKRLQRYGFGVDFFEPVDFYHLASRAAKYGILFIALTFLTVFLMESASGTATHPAQFILIGIAQSVFFLLLISLSEQIGFALAYLAASAATILLLGYYGLAALKLGRGGWVLIGTLSLLYGIMYLILRSADYALLAGSILAFVAVAVTMVLTRNEDWRKKPI